MDEIITDQPADGVFRITLNRPDQLNALTYPMYEALLDIFNDCRFDSSVRSLSSPVRDEVSALGMICGAPVRQAGRQIHLEKPNSLVR